MSEAGRNTLIFVITFLVSIFAYMGLKKALHRSFKNMPDATSYTEKKNPSGIFRTVKAVGMLVLICLFLRYALPALSNFLEDRSERASEQRQEVIDEYEALGEDNVDPETGRMALTENYLMKDYKLYVIKNKGRERTSIAMYMILFVFVVLYAGGAACIEAPFRFYIQKKKIPVLSVVAPLLLIPTFFFGYKILRTTTDAPHLSDPKDVKVYATPVTIVSRRENTVHDDEDGDRTTYFITIDYGDGKGAIEKKVDGYMYFDAELPGDYLMGQYEEDGKVYDFQLYTCLEYEEDVDL